MPSWKKVIISGSNAALNSLTVTNGITGSLFGTSSWAVNAITASSAQNAQDILIYVKNVTGAQIDKGKVVRISGATGNNPLIATASYESDSVSANTLGITTQNIPNDSFGYVITEGTLLGINTDAFSAGQLLYLGPTGSIIGTAPVAPLHSVRLGQVLRVQQNNGSMYVRIDNGYELGELHDVVDNTTTSSYGDLLVKSGSVWTNSKQLTGSYGLTGSLNIINGGITGSLFGTASFASQALSASFITSSNVFGPFGSNSITSASFAVSSSRAISSSFAQTASFLNSTTNAFIQNGNSFGTTALLGTNDNQPLALETNGTTRMFISSSGNVGIGTTTPTSRFTVDDSTAFSWGFPSAASAKIGTPGTGGSFMVMTPSLNSSYESGFAVDGTYTSGKSVINLSAFGAYSGGPYSADIAFKTATNTTLSEKMRITNDGNVGIGTTSPNYTTSGRTVLDINGSSQSLISLSVGGTGKSLFFYSGTDLLVSNESNGAIKFNTNGSEKAIITSAGNVGIGTSSPSQKLDVYGVAVFGTNTNRYTTIGGSSGTMYTQGETGGWAFGHHAKGSSGTDRGGFGWLGSSDAISYYYIGAAYNTATMYITSGSSGAVGIGTSSPFGKMTIIDSDRGIDGYGNLNIFTNDSAATSKGGSITFGGNNSTGGTSPYVFAKIQGIKSSEAGSYRGSLRFGTAAASSEIIERMRIDHDGNVGIGATSPGNKLQISTADSSNQLLRLGVSYDSSRNLRGGINWHDAVNTTGQISTEYDGTMTSMVFGSLYNSGYSSNTLMTLRGNGNLGIGTSSPSKKLDVSGSDALINGVTVGRGGGNIASNTAIGSGSLRSTTSATYNTAVGTETLRSIVAGASNTAVGYRALYSTKGNGNVAIGDFAGANNTGDLNIIIGHGLDYRPDQTYFTGYNTLSIGKNSADIEGLPHIWAPDSVVIADTYNDPILTLDPSVYSAFFIEYVLDNTNGVMRAGTIKGIFISTMSSIEWTEDSTLSIGDTSAMVFTVVDNGSSRIEVRLENTSGNTVYCNFTSRLILRQL